jgi:hypothetical protein
MDFFTSLLEGQGFDAVLVIMDYFSMLAYMVPTRGIVFAYETTKLFFSAWWKNHRLPRIIVLDQHPKV